MPKVKKQTITSNYLSIKSVFVPCVQSLSTRLCKFIYCKRKYKIQYIHLHVSRNISQLPNFLVPIDAEPHMVFSSLSLINTYYSPPLLSTYSLHPKL